jgi:hypothetical protein
MKLYLVIENLKLFIFCPQRVVLSGGLNKSKFGEKKPKRQRQYKIRSAYFLPIDYLIK